MGLVSKSCVELRKGRVEYIAITVHLTRTYLEADPRGPRTSHEDEEEEILEADPRARPRLRRFAEAERI